MVPTEINLAEDKKVLSVNWPDGRCTDLSAIYLRQHCQSAGAKRARLDNPETPIKPDLTIRDVRAVGAYAINLAFSDGHDRGIYPWVFLRELGEKSALGN